MKPFLPTVIGLLVSAVCLAQEPSPFRARNTVYVELLGSGGLYSVNYERLVATNANRAYGVRVGTSYLGRNPAVFSLIGEACALVGAGRHHGDFGLGLTGVRSRVSETLFSYRPSWGLYAVPRVGYRYQKPDGGLMLRAGFTPFVRLASAYSGRVFWPFAGMSVGYSF